MKKLLPFLALLFIGASGVFAADANNCQEVFNTFKQYSQTGYGQGLLMNKTIQTGLDVELMNLYQTCRIASALEIIAERMK